MTKRNDIFSQGVDKAKAIEQMEKQFAVSKNDFLEKDFGISVPVYEAMLPSKGLLYAEDHPLFKQETVEFVPMSVQEEDIIRDRKLIENNTMGVELIRSCLVNKRIDPRTLFPGDALAILYSIRAMSYGAEFKTHVNCPKCGENQQVTIDLTLIEEKPLPEGTVEGSCVFSTKTPSGITIEYKILTENEELTVSIDQKARVKKGLRANDSELFLQSVIVSANGITDRSKINMLVSRMPAKDALHIRKEVIKTQPGLISQYHFSCDNGSCGYEAQLPIPLSLEFWLPEIEK